MDLFTAYRKCFASLDDAPVVWWYCGVVSSEREGVGKVPIAQAETIMVYRTRTLDADTYTIDWTEIGYFRDLATGEVLDGWFNPATARVEPYPKTFADGPATFTVRRATNALGLDIALVQHQARIDGVQLDAKPIARTLGLVQTETKTRTFHRADGSLPALDSGEATAIETVLSIWGDHAAIEDTGRANAPSHGFYRSGARQLGAGGGSWASTTVQGVMRKARDDERLNPVAWARLEAMHPRFFRDGRIAPDLD